MPRKKPRRTGTNKMRYEQVLKNITPIIIGLMSSSSRFDQVEYGQARLSKSGTLKNSISASYKLEHFEKAFFESRAKFKYTMENEEHGIAPVTIECVFYGDFQSKSPLTKELAELFTTSEFRVIVWPYFRQFVQDMTARMSIPPAVVPFSVES